MRTKPIIALDIDGTLGNYHKHFLEMAALYLNRPMPDAEDLNPGLRLHKFMGVSLRDYRAAKLAFRQGGFKRWMPCYDGAAELTTTLRRKGRAEIWICTTRPYNRLDSIDPDTQEWLKRNGIQYDHILYGEDKYNELRRQAGGRWGRVAGVLEDLPELWEKARKLFPDAWVCLRDQPYNRVAGDEPIQTMMGIKDLYQAQEVLMDALDEWRDNRGYNEARAGNRRSNAR